MERQKVKLESSKEKSKVARKENCSPGIIMNLIFYMLCFKFHGDILGTDDSEHGVAGRAETEMRTVNAAVIQ